MSYISTPVGGMKSNNLSGGLLLNLILLNISLVVLSYISVKAHSYNAVTVLVHGDQEGLDPGFVFARCKSHDVIAFFVHGTAAGESCFKVILQSSDAGEESYCHP